MVSHTHTHIYIYIEIHALFPLPFSFARMSAVEKFHYNSEVVLTLTLTPPPIFH